MKKRFHIGSIIEAKFREKGWQVKRFAGELCTDRSNVYKIFRRQSIDTELLLKISIILGHDFFREYSRELGGEKPGTAEPVFATGPAPDSD